MFEVFEINIPSKWQQYLNSQQNYQSYMKKFISGVIAGLISSPCLTPVLFTVLASVSSSNNLIKGMSLLFFFALGFGTTLFILSLSPYFLSKFKKIHIWTPIAKYILGVLILFICVYYSLPFFGFKNIYYVAFFVSALTGIILFFKKIKKISGLILLVGSVFCLILNFISVEKKDFVDWKNITTYKTKEYKKPVVLNFVADWCISCKQMSLTIFQNKKIKKYNKNFIWVKYDATKIDANFLKIKKQFDIYGLPTILFLNSQGIVIPELTVKGLVNYNDFEIRLKKLKNMKQIK